MRASGFVLAGGASKRMGRPKALLAYHGTTLAEFVAERVREAAGTVALIGDPLQFGHLGLPVFADAIPGCGPGGGILTALQVTATDWNLIVACDMPGISSEALRELLECTETAHTSCVAAAASGGRPEPLCAAYHRRCAPALAQAIRDKRFRMRDLIEEIGVTTVALDAGVLVNVNTPSEWAEIEGGAG
jgi:molybdenum cofactor guanylyltransferase